MLVLSRKRGQQIQIGDNISVTVLGVHNGTVRLGFEGPADVPIHREEVHQRIVRELAGENTPRQHTPATPAFPGNSPTDN
jgi:carbon storage regulator